jgi:uncharacterized membrane protein
MTMRRAVAVGVFSGLAALSPVAAGQVVILPGTVNTGISAISDDGTRVAGTRTGLPAYFWSQATGYQSLTSPRSGSALLLAGDGRTIAATSSEFSTQNRTFIESDTGTVVFLPFTFPGQVNGSLVTGISRDASVLCGWDSSSSTSLQVGWRWSASGGMQVLPGFSFTLSMSGDGRTIFGGNGSGAYGMWRDGVVTSVPGALGRVQAVNYDGSIFAGDGRIWNNGQIITMPLLPGGGNPEISDISEDGSVVVGSNLMELGRVPIVWTQAGGTQPLAAYFASYGYDLSGYQIWDAHISSDGRTFGLSGVSLADGVSHGIIVTVPAPTTIGAFVSLVASWRRRRP